MVDHGSTFVPLMLSISGCRGLFGQTMTPEVAARFGAVFGMSMRVRVRAGGGGGGGGGGGAREARVGAVAPSR